MDNPEITNPLTDLQMLMMHLKHLPINRHHFDTLDDNLRGTVDKAVSDGLAEWNNDKLTITDKGREYEIPES